MERQYWTVVFTGRTWDEFIKAGGKSMGFREHRTDVVQRMRPGDRLLCYVSKVSRWIGILEVAGGLGRDKTRIFSDESFPLRVPVKVIEQLTRSNSIPVRELLPRFSWWNESLSPAQWGARLQTTPTQMNPVDGSMVELAIREAVSHPVSRPVVEKRWQTRPRTGV